MKWLIISLFIFWPALLSASFGCLDSSWHTQKFFDTKEYHIVTRKVGNHETFCPCPCSKLSLNRGECTQCHHRHFVPQMHIIRYKK